MKGISLVLVLVLLFCAQSEAHATIMCQQTRYDVYHCVEDQSNSGGAYIWEVVNQSTGTITPVLSYPAREQTNAADFRCANLGAPPEDDGNGNLVEVHYDAQIKVTMPFFGLFPLTHYATLDCRTLAYTEMLVYYNDKAIWDFTVMWYQYYGVYGGCAFYGFGASGAIAGCGYDETFVNSFDYDWYVNHDIAFY